MWRSGTLNSARFLPTVTAIFAKSSQAPGAFERAGKGCPGNPRSREERGEVVLAIQATGQPRLRSHTGLNLTSAPRPRACEPVRERPGRRIPTLHRRACAQTEARGTGGQNALPAGMTGPSCHGHSEKARPAKDGSYRYRDTRREVPQAVSEVIPNHASWAPFTSPPTPHVIPPSTVSPKAQGGKYRSPKANVHSPTSTSILWSSCHSGAQMRASLVPFCVAPCWEHGRMLWEHLPPPSHQSGVPGSVLPRAVSTGSMVLKEGIPVLLQMGDFCKLRLLALAPQPLNITTTAGKWVLTAIFLM